MDIGFHEGDRFVVKETFAFAHLLPSELIGKTGTVVGFEPDWILVEMDEYFARLHTLDGRCEDGHGYYILKDAVISGDVRLELLSDQEEVCEVSQNSLNLLLEG